VSDCNIVNVSELPYPFKQVLTSFFDSRFLNDYGFEGEEWSAGFNIDFDPQVRANWGTPKLGSLNTDSNMFHELITQEVTEKMDLIIKRLFKVNSEDTVEDLRGQDIYVDAVDASHEEPYESFGTYYWSEVHTNIGDKKTARIDFITRGHVCINILYEKIYEGNHDNDTIDERLYLIPMELAGYLTVTQTPIFDWRVGETGESTLTLSQIDDGIVNMRSISTVWECIQ
jgi:hypothetical protein